MKFSSSFRLWMLVLALMLVTFPCFLGFTAAKSKTPTYVAIVEGTALPTAKEFSVDLFSVQQVVLHMNTRFFANLTIFNTRDSKGQWGEEHSHRFSGLRPGQHFKIIIKALPDGTFRIDVNGETFSLAQRLFSGPAPSVEIGKVGANDVIISHLKVLKGFALWRFNHSEAKNKK